MLSLNKCISSEFFMLDGLSIFLCFVSPTKLADLINADVWSATVPREFLMRPFIRDYMGRVSHL